MGLLDRLLGELSRLIDPEPRSAQTAARFSGGDQLQVEKNPVPVRPVSRTEAPQTDLVRSRPQELRQSPVIFKSVKRTYKTASGGTFTPLWQRHGWKVNTEHPNRYIGAYRFYEKKSGTDLKWDGAIRKGLYGVDVYIRNPPAALYNHKHWQCFFHKGNGWYLVHFINKIHGLDDAILNVQRLITEAYLFC